MPVPSRPSKSGPVLIVGGGGAGLDGVDAAGTPAGRAPVVSARPQTSDLPKAHVLNQRAMEVLDDVGVAETIAEPAPPEQMAATAFYAGFAGPDRDYGRRLSRLESWGAGGEDESWRAASPWRQLNLPQIRLEPLMKARVLSTIRPMSPPLTAPKYQAPGWNIVGGQRHHDASRRPGSRADQYAI